MSEKLDKKTNRYDLVSVEWVREDQPILDKLISSYGIRCIYSYIVQEGFRGIRFTISKSVSRYTMGRYTKMISALGDILPLLTGKTLYVQPEGETRKPGYLAVFVEISTNDMVTIYKDSRNSMHTYLNDYNNKFEYELHQLYEAYPVEFKVTKSYEIK